MKLLYSYFDFDSSSEGTSYRGLGDCGLNFSTSYEFEINRNPTEGETGAPYQYCLSCQKKANNNCIPSDFWGNRIYNVTALVGNNGAGKSSLLHSLIKAMVKGMDPGVPFLLVLQKTESEEFLIYYGGGLKRDVNLIAKAEDFPRNTRFIDSYPEELETVKISLLDNTLSVSAIELGKAYSRVSSPQKEGRNRLGGIAPVPIPECVKQFYNKSLISSLQYSNEISSATRSVEKIPVDEELSTHFRYETFQEARFLFDRFQQSTLETLAKAEYPVPRPKYLFISICSIQKMFEIADSVVNQLQNEHLAIPPICSLLYDCDLMGKLAADALFAFYYLTYGSKPHQHIVDLLFDNRLSTVFCDRPASGISRAKQMLIWLRGQLDAYSAIGDCSPKSLQEAYRDLSEFLSFLVENEVLLSKVICPSVPSDFNLHSRNVLDYRIDIQTTVAETERRDFVIAFLDNYRQVSKGLYFLTFSSGLSSGEKNLLRMLTQLRYALNGPSVYEEGTTDETNTKNFLMNRIYDDTLDGYHEKDCDTLILFLDEADLTFHPEWQRKLVSMLTKVLPRMFRDPYSSERKKIGCKDIQVILATHSPLMLSDIPLQSCIFLRNEREIKEAVKKSDEQDPTNGNTAAQPGRVIVDTNPVNQQTFGSNIHELLNNAFFLTRTIGEHSHEKIITIYKELKELEGKPDDNDLRKKYQPHLNTIQMIGDPIVRNKLLNLYNRCFPTEKNVTSVIYDINQVAGQKEFLQIEDRESFIQALENAARKLRQ